MQHASDGFVATWKREVVCKALTAQGLSAGVVREGVLTSPPRSRRRATLAVRKTKGGALVGFHARGSDMIVPIPGCTLLHPDLIALIPAVEALAQAGGSRTQELSVTLTRSLTGPDVRVEGGKPLDAALRMDLARLAERQNLPVPALQTEAELALQRYDFPGNVRELENILERALALSDGGRITPEDLMLTTCERDQSCPVELGDKYPLQDYLDRVEKAVILEALEKTRFNRTQAARILGVTFRSMRYRLERLGIQ